MANKLKQLLEKAKWWRAGERGASTIEYVAIAAVSAAIVGAVLLAMQGGGGARLSSAVSSAMQRIAISFEPGGGSTSVPSIGQPSRDIVRVGIPSIGILDFISRWFSPPERAAADQIQHIEDRYGIELINDSDKQWTKREVEILEEVLQDLPPEFRDRTREFLKRMVRSKQGPSDRSLIISGEYYPYSVGPQDRWLSIYIYDAAYSIGHYPYSLWSRDKRFKSILLHEITHAIQVEHKITTNEDGKTIITPVNNALVLEYAEKFGWVYKEPRWTYRGKKSDLPYHSFWNSDPYSGKDPFEDMSEAVTLYVYNPSKLSKARYEFLKERVFDGKEFK